MNSLNAGPRPSTPPQSPIYNVRATNTQIKLILKHALPSATLLSSKQLPSGSSYNNRLYDLTISPSISPVQPSTFAQSLILKITGRFWKHSKTLNEAVCLQLLSRHPALPVPRLIAFSADSSCIADVPFEWILMSKMPGSSLSEVNLDLEDMRSIARDLADFIRILRAIPSPSKIGNLVGLNSDGAPEIGALVDIPSAKGWPYESHLEYQAATYEAAMESLANEPIYARNAQPNNGLVTLLRNFTEQTLPKCPIFHSSKDQAASILTHADLSQRNILVHRPSPEFPLRVSAVVDWEFSGFFSPYEEFLAADSDLLNFSSDTGPDSLSDHLLTELALRDVSTPQHGWLREHWELARRIHRVRENIAPWWVRELDLQSSKLREELATAEATIVQILQETGTYDGA